MYFKILIIVKQIKLKQLIILMDNNFKTVLSLKIIQD